MRRHPYFDLQLHSDSELEELLGAGLGERVTLHEWPLSCVQRVTLQDGRKFVYKAESGPTVESEFYACAVSDLLPQSKTVFRDGAYTCLILEWIEAPLLESLNLSEEDAWRYGKKLLNGIHEIKGPVPVYLDVGSWERWRAIMDGMVEDLNGLMRSGVFRELDVEKLRWVARRANSAQVHSVFDQPTGLVHGDLSAENIFVSRERMIVIDWQRPMRGPVEVDLAQFYASLGFDARQRLTPGIEWVTDLLRIHWLCECTLCWFPDGRQTYDRTIAQIAAGLGDSFKTGSIRMRPHPD
jgi:hypothetical protein